MALASVPGSVKLVQVIGEALTNTVVSNMPNNVSLWNWYGPTEVSISATMKHVDHEAAARLSSIGGPLENVACYIVDPDTISLLPIGVYGELWLGGV